MKKNLLMGVGNDIRGDDAVGEMVAREFEKDDWETVDCGSVPENHIAMIQDGNYELVMIVDAAMMQLDYGEIRIVPRENLGVFTMSTHALPLSLVMDHLADKVERVILVGIQPKDVSLKEGMTEELKEAKDKLIDMLHSGEWEDIPNLEK